MTRLTLRKRITVLALAAALATPWVAAAAPSARQHAARPSLLGQIWLALTSLWSTRAGATVTPDAGCRMDPSGMCLTGDTAGAGFAVTPDEGCRMDPNGMCLTGG